MSNKKNITRIINRMRTEREKLLGFFTALLTRIFANIYGIQLSKGCKFYGFPRFRLYPGSVIKIENNCTFRSSETSNSVGNTHRCMFRTFKEKSEIIIGRNSGFSSIAILAATSVKIGNEVLIGANTTIMDHDGHADKSPFKSRAIMINNKAWIGMNTLILKGVNIGKNSIIGANSVVRSNIPDNVIAAGNPCKVLMKISDNREVRASLSKQKN